MQGQRPPQHTPPSPLEHVRTTPAPILMHLVYKLNIKMTPFSQILFNFGEKEGDQDKSPCPEASILVGRHKSK